jgi:hypothetical protein
MSAVGSADGFLPVDLPGTTFKQLRYVSPDGATQCRVAGISTCRASKIPEGSLYESALGQRAWTTQEGILPHRVLHFGLHEIIWDCDTSCACECGDPRVHRLWKNEQRSDQVDQSGDTSMHIINVLSRLSEDGKYRLWEEVIENYSSRSLTVQSDKLPAVSGLARIFRAYMDIPFDDYLAGMWRSTLPAGLLWSVPMRVVGQHSRPQAWRAPSWSWASIDGEMKFHHQTQEDESTPKLRILSCHCPLLSDDSFGQVQRGYIRLQCHLVAVELHVNKIDEKWHDKKWRNAQSAQSVAIQWSHGLPPDSSNFDREAFASCKDGRTMQVKLDTFMGTGVYNSGVYCMAVLSSPRWLVIRKCSNPFDHHAQLEAFERIGVAFYNNRLWPQVEKDVGLEPDVSEVTELLLL